MVQKLLNAWAEAMQYDTNQKAPDDQVLDTLLKQGGWLERVSLGWLPSSYLRLMPSFYRGVRAVIDHDHGSAPGIDGHSRVKPKLPPTVWTEPVNEAAYMDADAAAVMPANSAGKLAGSARRAAMCSTGHTATAGEALCAVRGIGGRAGAPVAASSAQ